MRPFWGIAFLLLILIACAGAFMPSPEASYGGGPVNTADVAWMLTATALVLLMTPGLSYFYGGMVSSKNVISTMLQSIVAMAVISILWVVVGFSLAFGDSVGGIIGNEIGRSLDERDRLLAQQTEFDALERGESGRVRTWRNPDNGRYADRTITLRDGMVVEP